MADQQRKVSLIFEANANQAKNEINGLISSLQKIQSTPKNLINFSSVEKASKAAIDLQTNLQKAINTDTGKLDLSRFATSLKNSKKDLEHYRDVLSKLGPDGNIAFRALSSNINKAQVSTVRLTKGMQDFLTTLKNTAKWQLSSSIMHGFMGAIQTAYGYAQSLDASLNNIRIVTGHSSEQMAKFAVEANRAAQALSTTTTKYTDAALIFYQQGLNDQAVKERTEAVIKMANVTGEVAADVSSYMTAIWNNFDDGSKSIEYYADVITKLGAATAASSEEIAGGLEKFAAIGNTIGLSYEYATSMITTIVDKTRQSEDVVGTALKTILARVQGLNLGDTLEDGTTLNKYSEALEKVGINIKDASGELKSMDNILDELGSKWGTLSKDTQIGLAQVVGGVRQYNQIIALMDNWGSFQNNVKLAEASAGSLNEQSEIFAEGWEAARNRVRTAAEGIYDALINEDAFIKLDNVFTGLLNSVSGLIKGMGGMVPIMGTIAGVITSRLGKEVPVALQRMRENLNIFTGKAEKDALDLQHRNTIINEDNVNRADNSYEAAQYETLRRISQMKEFLIKNQKNMNSAQIEEYNLIIQNEQAIRDMVEERAKSLSILEDEIASMQDLISLQSAMDAPVDDDLTKRFTKEAEEDIKQEKETESYKEKKERKKHLDNKIRESGDLTEIENQEYENLIASLEEFDNVQSRVFDKRVKYIKDLTTQMVDYSAQQGKATRNADSFKKLLNDGGGLKQYGNNLQDLKIKLENWDTASFQNTQSTNLLKNALDLLGKEGMDSAQQLEEVEEILNQIVVAESLVAKESQNASNRFRAMAEAAGGNKEKLLELQQKGYQWGPKLEGVHGGGEKPQEPKLPEPKAAQLLTESLGALMATYGTLNAVVEANKVIMDEDATAMEKIGAGIGVLVSIMGTANSLIEVGSTIKLMGAAAAKKLGDAELIAAGKSITLSQSIRAISASILSIPGVGWALGIVAALTAVGIALYAYNNRATETEKKIKSLKEESQTLGKVQEKLTEQIEETQTAWDNYQDMVKALEECTTGTDEWYQALRNVNQSILDILKTSPSLAKYIQYDENGRAYLNEVIYDEYIKSQQREAIVVGAQKTIIDTDISDLQNQEYLFGSESQQLALNKFWGENIELNSENVSGILSSLLEEVFLNDIESFGNYLEKSGLANIVATGRSVNANFVSDSGIDHTGGYVYVNGQDLARIVEEGSSLFIDSNKKNKYNTLETEWKQALELQLSNQVQRGIAYQDLFNSIEGYNNKNLKLYNDALQLAIENKKKEVTEDEALKYFNSLSLYEEELTIKNGKVYAGEEALENLTLESMLTATALAQLSEEADNLSNIVTEQNLLLEGYTDYGKSVLRQGATSGGAIAAQQISDLNLLSSSGLPKFTDVSKNTFSRELTYEVLVELWEESGKVGEKPTEEDAFNEDFRIFNLNLIRTLEGIIGTSIEDSKLSDATNLQAKTQDILNYVIENIPEMNEDTANNFLANLFSVDGKNFNLQQWQEDFGELYGIEVGASAVESAEAVNNAFKETNEYIVDEWLKGAKQFSNAIKLDENGNIVADTTQRGGQIAQALLDKNLLSAEITNIFMSAFDKISGGMTDKAVKTFETEFLKLFNSVEDGENAVIAFNKAIEQVITSGKDLTTEDLTAILKETGVETDLLNVDLTDLAKTINTAASSVRSFEGSVDTFINTLGSGREVIDKLKKGQKISTEEYEKIKDFLTPEQQSLFLHGIGGMVYYGDEQQTQEIKNQHFDESLGDLTNKLQAIYASGDFAFKNSNLSKNSNLTDILSWVTLGNDIALTKFANATGVGGNNLKDLISALDLGINGGIGINESGRLIDYSKTGENAQTIEIAQNFAQEVLAYLSNSYGDEALRAQEVALTSAGSTDEIGRLINKGDIQIGENGISEEIFEKVFNNLQLDEYTENLGFDREEIDEFGNSLQDLAKDSEYLADTLEDNAIVADDLAAQLMRYDRAIESIQANTKDWTKSLKENKKDTVAYNKTIKEMKEALSDIYDIDVDSLDGLDLDWDALNEDMIAMAEGSGEEAAEAYQRGMDRILDGMVLKANPNIDLDTTQFYSSIDDMWFTVNDWQNYLYDALHNIEAGGIIDGPLLASLEEMLSACFDTVGEAQRALDAMDVDGVVTLEDEEVVNESPTNSIQARIVDVGEVRAPILSPVKGLDYGPPLKVQGVEYNAIPAVETSTGSVTNMAFKIEPGSGKTKVTRKAGSRAKNNFGARPSATRGSGGRRGGGGGETRAVRGTTKPTSEKERYHTIKNQLEDITDNYDKISKAADRAFGKAKIKLLQEQQKELKKLTAAQQEYIKEIEQNLASDKKNLDQVSAYVGFDVEFDENGTITNFDKIQDALYDIYNSKIDENDEVVGLDEEAWEKFQEEWEKILALIEQYEETQDLRKEALQELQDYINDIYDLQLEEITYSVEIDIEAAEFSLELLDHLIGLIEDDAWDAAEAIALMGEKAANLLEQNDTYTSGIERVMGMAGQNITDAAGNVLVQATTTAGAAAGYIAGQQEAMEELTQAGLNGAFTEDAVETLKDYHSSLLEISESLIELREEVYATVLRAFEAFNEEMDSTISKIEHLRNMTKYYKDIVDIVGKENLNVSQALMESVGQIGVQQAVEQLESVKVKRDTITEEIAIAEEKLQSMKEAGLEEDVKLWEKNLKVMYESLYEAEEEFMSIWTETLELINEQFEMTIHNISETFSDALAGPMRGSLDDLQNAFERINSLNEIHLADYEKIYHLSTLARDISKSIDETDNIKGKQKLAELQEEINSLEENGAKISSYQTEDLRRRYELKLAEIALEEAKNTKSNVQMTRDSSGKWNYVYTADEDAVAEAEQNYEDKLFEIQKANAEYINTMENNLIQAQIELQAKIEEIALDQTLSMEEKQAMIDEYTEYYTAKFQAYASELELVLDNNALLYQEDWLKYSELTGYRISADEQYIDKFEETTYSIASGFTSLEQVQNNFKAATELTLNNINTAFNTWATNVDTAMNAAGTSLSDFNTTLEEEAKTISTKTTGLRDEMVDLGTKASGAFGDIANAAESFALSYSALIDDTIKKNAALASSFSTLLDAWSDYQTGTTNPSEPPVEPPVEPGVEPDDEEPEVEPEQTKGIGTLTIAKGYKYYIYTDAKGNNNTGESLKAGTYEFTERDYSTVFKRVYIPSIGGWVSTTDPDEDDNGASRLQVAMFDTGGYTGTWGSSGKMAMLHEKELILNADDTSNILSAVNLIRKISDTIDLNAIAAAGINSKTMWTNKIYGEEKTIEQNVHITAEFPNATDRNEIYEAFNDLINLATQHASKR